MSVRRWARYWPFVLWFMGGLINSDVIIFFSSINQWVSRFLGGDALVTFLALSVVATLKLFYGYWFLGWLGRLINHTHAWQELVDDVKEVARYVDAEEYVEPAIARWKKRLNPAAYKDHWAAKTGGYFSITLLGINPGFGTRLVGLVGCRAANSILGLSYLAALSVLRTAYLMGILRGIL